MPSSNAICFNSAEIVAQLGKKSIRTGQINLKSVLFAINCLFLSIKMVYSSPEPQFVCVSAVDGNAFALQDYLDCREKNENRSIVYSFSSCGLMFSECPSGTTTTHLGYGSAMLNLRQSNRCGCHS